MNLKPLLDAPPVVQAHAALAGAAFLLGAAQLALPKGTMSHRVFGYAWVCIMAFVALSSFAIRVLNPRHFSPIHALSVFILILLPVAVLQARRGRIRNHARAMTMLFLGALLIAGAFTLLPGRIMGRVMFGALSAGCACG